MANSSGAVAENNECCSKIIYVKNKNYEHARSLETVEHDYTSLSEFLTKHHNFEVLLIEDSPDILHDVMKRVTDLLSAGETIDKKLKLKTFLFHFSGNEEFNFTRNILIMQVTEGLIQLLKSGSQYQKHIKTI